MTVSSGVESVTGGSTTVRPGEMPGMVTSASPGVTMSKKPPRASSMVRRIRPVGVSGNVMSADDWGSVNRTTWRSVSVRTVMARIQPPSSLVAGRRIRSQGTERGRSN